MDYVNNTTLYVIILYSITNIMRKMSRLINAAKYGATFPGL